MVVLYRAMFDHLTLLELSFLAGNFSPIFFFILTQPHAGYVLVFFPLIIILLFKIKQIYYTNFVNQKIQNILNE